MCLSLSTSTVCRGQSGAPQASSASAFGASRADVEAAVAILCKPANITRSKNGNITGCRVCPEGTDFSNPNSKDSWTFAGAMAGHFMLAGEETLTIDGSGCDSHASNWGGSFIFWVNAERLQFVRYDQGLHTAGCHKFRYTDGREFLVCRGGWSGQGENDASVFLTRFDATGKNADTVIFTTSDATANCGDDSSVKVPLSGIKNIKFSSKESGELKSMTITATFGQVTCGEVHAKRAPGKEMPSVKTYELHYIFDGKQFTIAPESKAALRAFPQQ
jgi:hypothetical protein